MDAAVLRTCPLFQSLSSDGLRKVAAIARHRDLAAGELVFREGDRGDEMYLVLSGKVRISKQVEGVGEEALAVLEPGSYFGEMAMIDGGLRSADARAHVASALGVLRREDLDHLMFVDKDLAHDLLWNFVRTLAARLRETNDKIKGFFALSRFE